MARLITKYLFLALLGVLVSCQHKDLDELRSVLSVSYDWSKAPQAGCNTMLLYLKYKEPSQKLGYNVPSRAKSSISVPVGACDILTFDNDPACSNIIFKEDSEPDAPELSTELFEEEIPQIHARLDTLPLPQNVAREDILTPPVSLLYDTENDFNVALDVEANSLVLEPENRAVDVYVTIKNVGNIMPIFSGIAGIVTGMASGVKPLSSTAVTTAASFPVVFSKNEQTYSFEGKFSCFGTCSNAQTNYLVVYLTLNNGRRIYVHFDVTNQVRSFAGSRTIRIEIDNFPKMISGDSFDPEIDGWVMIDQEIDML